MNRSSLFAIAAVIVVLVAGGAYLLTTSPRSAGGPRATAAPTPTAPTPTTATPSPAPPSNVIPAAAAQALWSDWVVDAPPLGLPSQGTRIQLSVDWHDGRTVWVQTNYDTGTRVFTSDSVAAPDGQLRVVTGLAADGCTQGDIGTYAWSRSSDGLYLTLTLVSDPCIARATTFARTWVHSLGAVNDGGAGVLPVDNIQLTMPHGRFGLSGSSGASDLSSIDAPAFVELVVLRNWPGFVAPCSAEDVRTTAPLTSPAAVLGYLRGLPGLAVRTSNARIGGHPAFHITAAPTAGATCAAGDIRLFPKQDGSGDLWSLAPHTPLSLWVLELNSQAVVIWYHGDQVTPAKEAQVISTIQFISKLPVP
jgi:hypothetical protein